MADPTQTDPDKYRVVFENDPLEAGAVRWLDAQTHSGENIGATPTHIVFVELKEPTEGERGDGLGPS